MSLHFESSGAGPALVLLHGWAMHSGIWRGVREQLERRFRLYLVDLPGHGFSPLCLRDPSTGPLECMVESILEMLPEDCIVCGWSLGGQVAIELARREPSRVEKLALISTTPFFVRHGDWQWGVEAGTFQLFAKNLKRDYTTTLNRFLTLQVSGSSDTPAVLARLRQGLLERGKPDEAGLEEGLQILLSSDLRDRIPRITQPVLLFHGENDVIAHPSASRWMSQQFRNAKLIMLPRCGHAPFLSYPDQFVDSMVGLLSSIN